MWRETAITEGHLRKLVQWKLSKIYEGEPNEVFK